MPNSNLIQGAEAVEVTAGIEDPVMRPPIQLLTQALVDYHGEQPTELLVSFDLVFFVNVLKETIEDISGLLRGTTPVVYWFEDYPKPDADETRNQGPTGLRSAHAHNFAARQSDARVQATLLTSSVRANVKQTLLLPGVKGFKQHGPGPQVVPEKPAQPMDYLFMLKAVANALEPGQPARVFSNARLKCL